MDLKNFCEKTNINYDELVGRFMGMESMCLKFIKKFIEDTSFQELQTALQNTDYELIERSAHTLKGVALNLGFQKIFEFSNQIVQDVRNNNYDNLESLNDNLKLEYNFIIETIKKLD